MEDCWVDSDAAQAEIEAAFQALSQGIPNQAFDGRSEKSDVQWVNRRLLDELAFVKAKNQEPGAIRRQIKINRGFRILCCGVTEDEE